MSVRHMKKEIPGSHYFLCTEQFTKACLHFWKLMKSNTHKIKTIAVLWFRLYLHVKLEKQHNMFNWIKALLLSAARWRETEQTQRERCVRVLGEQDLTLAGGLAGDSQKLGLGAFLKGKKSLKGSAMLLSWQHCASPFLQLWVGPRVKQKIRVALIAR